MILNGFIWDLGGCWGFLTGDLEDGVIFDIINDVSRCLGRYPKSLKIQHNSDLAFYILDHVNRWMGKYPESLLKFWHDLAEKKLVPGWGLGWGWVFSNFEDWLKLIKKRLKYSISTQAFLAAIKCMLGNIAQAEGLGRLGGLEKNTYFSWIWLILVDSFKNLTKLRIFVIKFNKTTYICHNI